MTYLKFNKILSIDTLQLVLLSVFQYNIHCFPKIVHEKNIKFQEFMSNIYSHKSILVKRISSFEFYCYKTMMCAQKKNSGKMR